MDPGVREERYSILEQSYIKGHKLQQVRKRDGMRLSM